MKKILVYASLSPEYMFDEGIQAGLSLKAAGYLRHFEAVELELMVDENGAVASYKIAADAASTGLTAIPMDRYQELLYAEDDLNALKRGGVHEWYWYEFALQNLRKIPREE